MLEEVTYAVMPDRANSGGFHHPTYHRSKSSFQTKSLGRSAQRGDSLLSEPSYILVVADDPSSRQLVTEYLENHSLPTRSGANTLELFRNLKVTSPSVIIIGLRAGRQSDAIDLVTRIRSRSNVPIILTFDSHIDEIDRVIGLELGADAYFVEPFSLRELLARVRALTRRQGVAGNPRARVSEARGYRFNGWVLECFRRRLLDPGCNHRSVSKGEYDLLLAFLERPRRILSREYLLQAIRVQNDLFGRTIDVRVSRLRRKLEVDTKRPLIIQTVQGRGYIFTPSVERF
jgi:two-component system, OmpR family, response regulator